MKRDEHIRRMQAYGEWPAFPFLPLKKYVKGEPMPRTGILVAVKNQTTTVFNENLFALPMTFADFKVHKKYESFESIADDGWVVD